MRVVAGLYKGRTLRPPAWEGLRPTSDKLRETLFNILAPRIEGARVLDGFANDDWSDNDDMPGPGVMDVRIESIGAGRTRMSIESIFPTTEAMEQLVAMGMVEGLTEAVGQIDAILAEDTVPAR